MARKKRNRVSGGAKIAQARSKKYKIVKAKGQGAKRNTRYYRKVRKGVYEYKLKNR